MSNDQPNSEVGFRQDATKFFITEAGFFEFDIDGVLTTITGSQAKALLFYGGQVQVIANSAGVISTINMPSVGYIIYSIADAASNASAWFTSIAGTVGQVLTILMRGVGSTGSILMSTSGVSLVGLISGDLSSIRIQNSGIYRVGASTGVALLSGMGYIRLLCTAADEWSVIEKTGGIVEQGSA